MMRRNSNWWMGLFGVIALSSVALAQTEAKPKADAKPEAKAPVQTGDLPKAEALLAKSIEASGGEKALRAIKGRTAKGTLEMAAAGITGSLEVMAAAPNRMRVKIDLGEAGKQERGTDGKVAWEVSSATGPRLIEGGELAQFMREADMYAALDWKRYYTKVETVGAGKVGERDVWQVDATPKDGPKESWFFDQQNGLMLKMATTAVTQMGDIEVESLLEDYRAVGDTKTPYTIRQRIMGMEQVMKMTEIQNTDAAPDSAFEPPAEIRELKAGGAATPKP